MKRIGLTQRSHAVAGYNERRDMLDQRWSLLVERLGACALPLANGVRDVDAYLDVIDAEALILTGGNDIAAVPGASDAAPERDRFEALAYRYFRERNKPVLGVCRGAQMINHLAGGKLVRMSGHAGCRHELVWAVDAPVYWDRPAEVNSYHGYVIPRDGLAPGMQALAWGPDGTVEAFHSDCGRIGAILWHPERELDLGAEAIAFLRALLGL